MGESLIAREKVRFILNITFKKMWDSLSHLRKWDSFWDSFNESQKPPNEFKRIMYSLERVLKISAVNA